MKGLIEEIKINKLCYLLEVIEKENTNKVLKAYKKIEKIKINKNIGLFLLNEISSKYGKSKTKTDIYDSIIILCLSKYYEEYTNILKKLFDKLSDESKNKIVYRLSTIDDENALDLYVDLILKYYKDSEFIPISSLFKTPYLYKYLFPKMYKVLKFKSVKNNALILINDFLTAGVVPKNDLKKNKKLIIDSICKVFDEALKYKFNNTFEALNNDEYKDLRFFLEISINIELYVSDNKTKEYLKKIYNMKDNQIKLFVLDNYYRKGENIDLLNYNDVSKDLASRYPLYEMLNLYEKTNLMPKKYMDQISLAKSDFYINFSISNYYRYEAENIEFIKKVNVNNYDYYVFKFKCTYEYDVNRNDFITDYICNAVGLNKYYGQSITDEFIGISGGYNKDKEISLIEYNRGKLLVSKINKDDNIDEIIDKLLKNDTNDVIEKIEPIKENIKESHIFTYILLFLFTIFLALLIYCMLYVYGVGSIKDGVNNKTINSVSINKKYEFKQINPADIFNRPEEEYYVLFYKNSSKKDKYYNYINQYLKRNIKFYYVDMSNKNNDFLYEENDLNFTLTNKDRLLKINSGEYEYYVDGKINILNEMKDEIEKIIIEEKKKDNEKKEKEQTE